MTSPHKPKLANAVSSVFTMIANWYCILDRQIKIRVSTEPLRICIVAGAYVMSHSISNPHAKPHFA